MAKFSPESNQFFDYFKMTAKNMAPTPVGSGTASPGDVFFFAYAGVERIVLVVRCKRGPGVWIATTTNNKILSCFNLTAEGSPSVETVEMILGILYKNRKKSSYQTKDIELPGGVVDSLKSLLGQGNYRTYIIGKISKPNRLLIEDL